MPHRLENLYECMDHVAEVQAVVEAVDVTAGRIAEMVAFKETVAGELAPVVQPGAASGELSLAISSLSLAISSRRRGISSRKPS